MSSNKSKIVSFIKNAPKNEWFKLPIEPTVLSLEPVKDSEEVDALIDQFDVTFLPKSLRNCAIKEAKVLWPVDPETPFTPVLSSVEIMRVGTKILLLALIIPKEYF